MDNTVIEIKGLSKVYKLYDKPIDRLKESLSLTHKNRHQDHYALNNINFTVRQGEILGIIGSNGSGKSTLLKIITGVLTPTLGEVNITGKVSALLELGAGFNLEYTGIENIYLNGTMLGYTKEEMDRKIPEIISFAEIGEFVYQPVKTYSSGMFARLAFAVSINVNPDILIVDEALSVGDTKFQQKCFRKMEEMKKTKTIIMVSHDIGAINKFCDRVIWIEKGELKGEGEPLNIIKQYTAYTMNSHLEQNNKLEVDENSLIHEKEYQLIPLSGGIESYGDKKAMVVAIGMTQGNDKQCKEIIMTNVKTKIILGIKYIELIDTPIVGFTIKDRLGNTVFQTNSEALEYTLESRLGYKEYCFEFTMPELNVGKYSISPAIASGTQSNHIQHNWIHDAYIFNIINSQVYNLEGFLSISNIEFSEV